MPFYDLSREELETYRPDLSEPAGLDEFWARTLAENPFDTGALTSTPANGQMRAIDVQDVTFPGFAGDPIRAWYTRPAGTSEDLPVVVEFIGYGGGRGFAHDRLKWAAAGFAHLVMDTRGQGSTWSSGGHTPDPHGSGPHVPGVMTAGIERPEDHFYRRAYVDAHHAVEAAAHLPGIDPTRIAVTGGSQGGAFTIAAASLNHRVFAAMPDVPFLSHFTRAVGLTDAFPYQEVVQYLAIHRGKEEMAFRTLAHFDGMYLGRRATAPALFSTALMDPICPPSTVFATRNWWGANSGANPSAEIVVYPFNQHEGGESYQWERQVAWLRDRL